MNAKKLAPLSGIVFVVGIVVGFIVISGDTPSIGDSAQKITSFYADHQGREIAAAIVVGVSTVFLALFVASLHGTLRAAERAGNFWSTVALIGGAAAVAGFLGVIGAHVALIDGADKNISGDAMVALNAIDNDDFFAFALPLGVMLLGAAGATIGSGALPKWLGWFGLVLAIVYFTPVGFISFGLTGIWIIIASIQMSRAVPA